MQQLDLFIEQVLLQQVTQPIVIFIDEIDSLLALSFPTEEFFALIRYCYENRASDPSYRRLTFVLLGVATPSDLIQDVHATPFNIGRSIELQGFQLQESTPLLKGLEAKTSNATAVLQAVLDWTGDQPFLTQKLCWMITTTTKTIPPGEETAWVEQLVRAHLIECWQSHDEPEHFQTICDRLSRNTQTPERLLQLYHQILKRGKIPARNTPDHLQLRLSGLVVRRGGIALLITVYTVKFLIWPGLSSN